METWFITLVSVSICLLIRATLSLLTKNKNNITLPPGPPYIPIITTLQWLRRPFTQLDPFLRTLPTKYGPITSLRVGPRPIVFISDRTLAHNALIQNSSVFSDRPKAPPTVKLISSNQHSINSASYGATWRTLRRNLASEMLHSSRVKSFSEIREWVLHTLLNRLKNSSETTDSVVVVDHFQYAMFSLLVFMCFGERVNDEKINDIERVQRALLIGLNKFNILNFFPRFLVRKRWEKLLKLKKDQEDVLLPLIRLRKEAKESGLGNNVNSSVVSYADTLLELELPEEKRKLSEDEMVSLCSEFLNAGTDTTSTALQWIMANLVKYPDVQRKVVEEITEVMGGDEIREKKEIKEEDLHKLPYLKCVILEGLRRHPPGHFVLPHAVKEDVVFNGYLVPKEGTVNFMVAEMGRDPSVWEDPMEFKPERFLKDETFDITGSKEIKMMPFGVGRRICPGYNLALLHLEYFVANLVWNFDWKLPEGGHVDLSEKQEFTVVMKNPLQVHISSRI
ncbi:cytochrome P450 89A2-like [Cicer arietinum]|uniref:Cytochrome P450 89A2-like n=1 Tax=Cicer arietinum TaxID=3827 RepID=A0A1S2YFU1_CICAR|nr:cytochrome P450 89A2-like [Cicer arietinum]